MYDKLVRREKGLCLILKNDIRLDPIDCVSVRELESARLGGVQLMRK